jgi:hypothetical protein
MDLRKHERITAESKCKASFRYGGQSYRDISVSNLGADGCCFQIPTKAANGIKNLAMLESLELSDPGLPRQAIQGKVVWVHSKKGAEKEFLETGVQFCSAPDGFSAEVDRYVTALVKFNPKTNM